MKRPHAQARGFTLIELLIASAIMIVAVAAASVALINQYKGMQAADLTRLANGENRAAIQSIEHNLRMLGWGIDPRYAIDLSYGCSSTPCRDRTGAPDDLVFVARDPMYQWTNNQDPQPDGGTCTDANGCFGAKSNIWPASADVGTGTIHVTLPTGVTLHKGQVVLLTCSQGRNAVMLTLSDTYVGNDSQQDLAPFTTNAPPYNDLTGIQPCHAVVDSAYLFLVDRFHYFIEKLPQGCTGDSASCTPWLMLDTGLDLNDDGTLPIDPASGAITDQADLIPVAKNVEDLQVAYVLNHLNPPLGTAAPDTNGDWILGNDRSSGAEEPVFGDPVPGSNPPARLNPYNDGSSSPTRFTRDPGNVRAVRVSLRIRSDHPDRTHDANWAGDALPFGENRTGTLQVAGYKLFTAETEIYTRNLESRSPFIQ